jgi:hypothetical protein
LERSQDSVRDSSEHGLSVLVFSGAVLEDDIPFGLDRLLFLMVDNAFRGAA